MGIYKHNWQLVNETSPSSKMLYHCPVCGLYDPAPVKEKYETRPCVIARYENNFEILNGKVYCRI